MKFTLGFPGIRAAVNMKHFRLLHIFSGIFSTLMAFLNIY